MISVVRRLDGSLYRNGLSNFVKTGHLVQELKWRSRRKHNTLLSLISHTENMSFPRINAKNGSKTVTVNDHHRLQNVSHVRRKNVSQNF